MRDKRWFKDWRVRSGIGAGVVVLLVGAGMFGMSNGREGRESVSAVTQEDRSPVAVTVARVTERPLERKVATVGTLYGVAEVTVTPKIEGVVTKVLHDVGDEVEQGEVLMEIEDTYYRLGVQEAERALDLELARLGLKNLPAADWTVDRVPMVVRARSLNEAERRLNRAKSLYASKVLSQEEMDRAQRDHEVALATYDQAKLEAQSALAAARLRQASLQTARQKLDDTKVRAPVLSPEQVESVRSLVAQLVPVPDKVNPKFFVAQRLVAEGEMIRGFPSTAAYRLVIDQALKLICSVPERYAGAIQVGQKAILQVEAYPQDVFEGRVSRINPVVDRASRALWLEVLVPNLDRRLKAGGFANVSIITSQQAKALTVPEEALVRLAGVTKVFVVRDGKAEAVEVQTGVRLSLPAGKTIENWVEVVGALSAGDVVVTTGQTRLVAGSPVRIRD
jgi:multidrug efflux pump subunit AcrA (membrane-fusion protein)